MTIHAVNTLEIKAAAGFEGSFHSHLVELVTALKGSPGCLSYDVTRSSQQENVWLVTGLWTSETAMQQHICSQDFGLMIWSLGCGAFSVRFACFLPNAVEAGHGA
ncbi:antibiotic biosynthesis monooxygenase [Pseudomonas sp. RC10]|uniref:antibiotic biosynthesis monooxygenase family protein n=1 Tax=Pseudomonas bambusae TaxID=3139142 RepID=UPI00313A1354